MQAIAFKASCPYELGDRIWIKQEEGAVTMEITDIITQMSARTGSVNFILELDGWHRVELRGNEEA